MAREDTGRFECAVATRTIQGSRKDRPGYRRYLGEGDARTPKAYPFLSVLYPQYVDKGFIYLVLTTLISNSGYPCQVVMALPQAAVETGEHKKVFGLTGGQHEELTFTLQVLAEHLFQLSSSTVQ